MIASELPDGSVVARRDVAFIKGGDVWWSSGVREPYDSIIVQDALDNGSATVLRVGAETDDAEWQWGARVQYAAGAYDVFRHRRQAAAQEDVDNLTANHSDAVTHIDLVRRWRAVGDWQVAGELGAEAADG